MVHRGTRSGTHTRNARQRMDEVIVITIRPRIAKGFVSMMNQEAKRRGMTWNQIAGLVIETGIVALRKERL